LKRPSFRSSPSCFLSPFHSFPDSSGFDPFSPAAQRSLHTCLGVASPILGRQCPSSIPRLPPHFLHLDGFYRQCVASPVPLCPSLIHIPPLSTVLIYQTIDGGVFYLVAILAYARSLRLVFFSFAFSAPLPSSTRLTPPRWSSKGEKITTPWASVEEVKL
jgi:hypothetical protein